MARIPLRLAGPLQLTTTTTTKLFTVPASTKYVVRHIHFENPSASSASITMAIGADGATTRIFDGFQLAGAALGVTASLFDHYCYYTLEAAEFLECGSSAALIVVTVNGDQIIVG
jgi:hypothetical protein